MKMQDLQQSPEAAGWLAALLLKLLPGGFGAAVMICVDPPSSKRELFMRFFVAFACSIFLGDPVMSWLHSLPWFAFLDPFRRAHQAGVDFIVGGIGWSVIGAAAMMLKKYRTDPAAAIADAKRALP